MSQNDRLKALAGIYKQADGNSFVILIKDDALFLKTGDIEGEKLIARGDGLYQVENTNAKIKFNQIKDGQAQSITFYLPDRQTVANRDVPIFKEKTLSEKFKELGVAAVVFLALVGLFFVSYGPMKRACLDGGSAVICKAAALSARVMGKTEESETLSSQESRSSYKQTQEEIAENCEQGDERACLQQAKSFVRLGKNQEANDLLKKGCYSKKHGPTCQFWRDFNIELGNVDKANEIMAASCDFNVAAGCYEWAWKLKREKGMSEALTFFDKACELEEEKSCYELGQYHLKYNRQRSLEYLIAACRSYHRQACDLKEKVEEYFKHKKECLNQNNARSCFLIASFEQDYGDKGLAMKQYRKSCDMGYKLACNIVNTKDKIKEMKESGESYETI